MAQNVSLLGANYPDVPAVVLPKTGGGSATFIDPNEITAQSKLATPSFSQQIIRPDSGFDYLSQVTVSAIPYTETDNAAGGKTVVIG